MIEIRDLRADEQAFLGEMLYAALAWRPDVALPPGRPGDTALVAAECGRPIGLVWCRLFTETEHGDGYVDEETPELAVAVVDGRRGRGVGTRLLEAMRERARRDGLGRLSLSVDADNPARRLYAALGWVEFEPEDGKGRMLLDL